MDDSLPNLPVASPQPPVGNQAVGLDLASAVRVEAATKFVETMYRTRPRLPAGKNPGLNAGWWGFLAGGASIGGASGLTLGTGTVTLCSRDGATCTADGDTVAVYNAGGSFTAPTGGMVVKLGWTDGDWSTDVAACSS